ncbi:hypothetical protein HPC38_10195 [Pasteurellaceae bacterium HPA106]|uniref:hypothetical protein n=1 Tax=Spirabiliibacterium pneumoniae TaxID=221400 RepID=UPI001AAD4C9E|nr:hypothetical protein [Spirabiliibacterium pneumoniae]MBE2897236.1 hypothetical protein [Spirabiliibacterium pneumoniae]
MKWPLTALCLLALSGCVQHGRVSATSPLVGDWVCPMTHKKQNMAQTDYIRFLPDGRFEGKGSFVYPMRKPLFRFAQTFTGHWQQRDNVVDFHVTNATLTRQHSDSTQRKLKTSKKWRAQEQALFARANAEHRPGDVASRVELIDVSAREFSYVQHRGDESYYGGCVRAHKQEIK